MKIARLGFVIPAGLVLAGALLAGPQAGEPVTPADADRFASKLEAIREHGRTPERGTRVTPVAEREVNAYLRFHMGPRMPVGLYDPGVTLVGEGRLAGEAVVDLDALRAARSAGGWLDPFSYLTGRLPVRATGILRTRSGIGHLELDSAEIGGVAVPVTMLQELVAYFSRTPRRPNGLKIDEPFELPANILEIQIAVSRAVVVQ